MNDSQKSPSSSKSQPKSGFKHSPRFRIQSRKDFLHLQSEGRKLRTLHFLLCFKDNFAPVPEESRLGITVTKRIDKRAVARNRIKRAVREVFRKRRPEFCRAVDMVVVALQGAAECQMEEIREEVEELLLKARLVRVKSEKIPNSKNSSNLKDRRTL